MTYKVSVQYGQGRESHFLENFDNEAAARAFIKEKMAEHALIQNAIYKLYEFDDLIETFAASEKTPATEDEQTSQSRGQGSTFQPTPFNTAPTPKGMPKKWIKDEDPDKKK